MLCFYYSNDLLWHFLEVWSIVIFFILILILFILFYRFFLPHGITVDNDFNIWVTDVALHQVFKLSPKSSKILLKLGEEFVPGLDPKHFCKPTSVAVLANGDFFVADGYCNSRIMKFNSGGTMILEWGRESSGKLH